MFTKRELTHLFVSILVLTFAFGFDDGSEIFVLNNWLTNFLRIFLLVCIALLFRELIVKLFAKRHDSTSEYRTWFVHRFWFNKELNKGIPLGIIISLFFTILSAGKFFFTALGVHHLVENKNARVGRKYQSLTYLEEAQIASMGILSSLFLAVVGLMIGRIFEINMSIFVGINFYVALFNMLPISNLDGAKIFFGSLLTYVFLTVFLIVSFLLIEVGIILGLLIAFIVSTLAMFIYYYFFGR